MILDILMSSLINGSVYALLAMGFSLIFGVARIVNVAHTAFYMLAAYCIYYGTHKLGVNPALCMLVAIVPVTLIGLLSYRLFIDPIREHEAAVLIATIALAMAMQEVMLLIFRGTFWACRLWWKDTGTFRGEDCLSTNVDLCRSSVGPVRVWALLLKTKLGLAIRSTAQDREVANLMGMNESRVAMITMGVSVGLAAFTGAVIAPLTIVNPFMWMHPLIMMMAVVVLGGLGSIKGSFIGAYILGFAESVVVFLIPMGAYLKGSVALSIMILVLLMRPEGLFGIAFEEER